MVSSVLLAKWSQTPPHMFSESYENIRIHERLIAGDTVLKVLRLIVLIHRCDTGFVSRGEADMGFDAGS
jgi:hypothetical protein